MSELAALQRSAAALKRSAAAMQRSVAALQTARPYFLRFSPKVNILNCFCRINLQLPLTGGQ